MGGQRAGTVALPGGRLDLRLTATTDESPPWDLICTPVVDRPHPVPPGTPISAVFKKLDRAMLVLGAPGSGKTTSLLELLRYLLTQAEHNPNEPIPVVLNLAAWAVRREPLGDWIAREVESYNIPERHVRAWLENEELLLLLDGLDEVSREHRAACVDAINDFHREQSTVGIAVTCRTADYVEFRTPLSVYGTVQIQPLIRRQVEGVLDRADGAFDGVRTALIHDPSLWDLLDTPLTLSIAVLAFREGVPPTAPDGGDLRERRDQLFTTYVRVMLASHRSPRWTSTSTVRWLAFVGHVLTKYKQTQFSTDLIDNWTGPVGRRMSRAS